MRIFLSTIFFALLLLPLTGCVREKYLMPAVSGLSTADTSAAVERVNLYSEEFRVFQHILLNVKGREFDFIGYLAFKEPTGFRALAYGELGGKIFDLLKRGEVREVVFKPPMMPVDPLMEGVFADIDLIFSAIDGEDSYLGQRDGYAFTLVNASGGTTKEFFFKAPDGPPSKVIEIEGGRIVREISYGAYKNYPGFAEQLPSFVRVKNNCWQYEMKIELLKIEVGPLGEDLFILSEGTVGN